VQGSFGNVGQNNGALSLANTQSSLEMLHRILWLACALPSRWKAKRAAGRFGGKIVEERVYEFDAGNPRMDSGHQQIQTQMRLVTQGASSHDVVWIVDTTERFGEYVPCRLSAPRPAVGTHGMSAVAWHRSYEQYAGMQMQSRFERFAKRIMTERDFSAWLAARTIGEAALRAGSASWAPASSATR
jgi:ABC transporter substrate binding protein (PQQ-dependent alcohol dehydrogenase system)